MIWVVTDHRETREALVPLIEKLSYEVGVIDCSDEVAKRIVFQSPALIIIDCGIDGGFELISKVRSHRKPKMAPIVMFSHDEQNLREKSLLLGADAYVPKGSLDWAELMEEVRRFAGPPPKRD